MMEGKLHCRLQDMGALLRGSVEKGATGKSKPWVWWKDSEVLVCSAEGEHSYSCVLGVCALGGKLCVVRQRSHIPRAVAFELSSWELEEVG